MILSKKSQLGLRIAYIDKSRLEDLEFHLQMNNDHKAYLQEGIGLLKQQIDEPNSDYELPQRKDQSYQERFLVDISRGYITEKCDHYFLITKGVKDPAEMIKLNTNFTTRSLKNMRLGTHGYLMGKDEFVKLNCKIGYVTGIYYNSMTRDICNFGWDLENDRYYTLNGAKHGSLFSRITRLLIFINLGDIEITILEGGRSNNKPRKSGEKVTNKSDLKIHVVDSTWNKLIVRTEGFKVKGHFRLQACGKNHQDRKLKWINAFQKNGYKRKPKKRGFGLNTNIMNKDDLGNQFEKKPQITHL